MLSRSQPYSRAASSPSFLIGKCACSSHRNTAASECGSSMHSYLSSLHSSTEFRHRAELLRGHFQVAYESMDVAHGDAQVRMPKDLLQIDRKSTRLNSSHL